MPHLHGMEVARRIRKRQSKTQVIVLSMHRDESYVLEALRMGAVAYVLKDASGEELVKAVYEAAANRQYLSPPLSNSVAKAYAQASPEAAADSYNSLSSREREVMQLAAEGHTNAEIGKRLFISRRTVEIHRANMMHKIGLRNHTELIRYAFKRGFLWKD
jgi:DNA-binding NarL/FixJ family response regulator